MTVRFADGEVRIGADGALCSKYQDWATEFGSETGRCAGRLRSAAANACRPGCREERLGFRIAVEDDKQCDDDADADRRDFDEIADFALAVPRIVIVIVAKMQRIDDAEVQKEQRRERQDGERSFCHWAIGGEAVRVSMSDIRLV
jgi:hypothetical protein